MAKNFRISTHRSSDSLHVRLIGDFDTSSAKELLDLLYKSCQGATKVFIHTSFMERIHPFAQKTFQKRIGSLRELNIRFVFTGDNAERLAPAWYVR